ncbi:MAG: ExbD/TolR family protein, partial [Planctomycetota bacterium]
MKSVREKAKEAKTELEMTPMIDVVFLLLIFFMCATKFKMPEGSLRSYLPRDRGSQRQDPVIHQGSRVTLIQQVGEIRVWADDVNISNTEEGPFERSREILGPNLDQIRDHLDLRKRTWTGVKATGFPVIIDFAEDVPWKYVVDVLNICRQLDIED